MEQCTPFSVSAAVGGRGERERIERGVDGGDGVGKRKHYLSVLPL